MIKKLEIEYNESLKPYFKDISNENNEIQLNQKLQYKDTIKINNQLYIKFPDAKSDENDLCKKCDIKKKDHQEIRSDILFEEFLILGQVKKNAKYFINKMHARSIFLAYWKSKKQFSFIEYYVNDDYQKKQEEESPFGGAGLIFNKSTIPVDEFLDNLNISYENLDFYYGPTVELKRAKTQLHKLLVHPLKNEQDVEIESKEEGYSKELKARHANRNNLPSPDGPYPRSHVIQVSLNDIEIGHNFQGERKKLRHTPYPGPKNPKYCYLTLPQMKLGVCNGNNDDGSKCEIHDVIKKVKQEVNKKKPTQSTRQGVRTDIQKQIFNRGLEEIYTSIMTRKQLETFESLMNPLNLLKWIDDDVNWFQLLIKTGGRFGSIILPPGLSNQSTPSEIQEKTQEEKNTLRQHLKYYYTQFKELENTYHDKHLDPMTDGIAVEKILEKMGSDHTDPNKNWVIKFGALSKWGSEECEKEISKRLKPEGLTSDDFKVNEIGEYIDPNFNPNILLCNLFSLMAQKAQE